MAVQRSQQRVTFVADELLGYAGNGIGTTTTFVSLALARSGYHVEILFAGHRRSGTSDMDWKRLYDDAGVRVHEVPVGDQKVEPPQFARGCDVDAVLRADPPDVVIVQDLGAPAYASLRLRRLGLAFEHTFFVVFCHGTRQWIAAVSPKGRVRPGAMERRRQPQGARAARCTRGQPARAILGGARRRRREPECVPGRLDARG